jgi:hypothetical protein
MGILQALRCVQNLTMPLPARRSELPLQESIRTRAHPRQEIEEPGLSLRRSDRGSEMTDSYSFAALMERLRAGEEGY